MLKIKKEINYLKKIDNTELNEHIDFLEDNRKFIKGVIFQSAKPSIFIAGADLKSFSDNSLNISKSQFSTFSL